MTSEQIRARLAAIKDLLDGITPADTGYSDEQVTQIESLDTEFEALEKQLVTADKVAALKAKATTSQGRQVDPKNASPVRIEVLRDEKARFNGFSSCGEFLMAVKQHGESGITHKVFQNAAFEKNGEDGGFLIPDEMAAGILKKLESSESLLASTTPLKCSGNSLTINVDESQPWNSGVQAYWMAEGGPFTQTKPVFKQAAFRLQKVGAMVTCTDELLDDAVALESYINTAAPSAIMHKINGAIINGNGVGKPHGLLSSGMTIQVSKEVGQAVDSVVARNVIKMYARMFPIARAGAAWYVNPAVEEQLWLMKDDLGNFIYMAPGSQMNQSPYGILLGRPVIPMMSAMPALGDAGDIIFGNLGYYYSMQKASGGVKSASSIHLYFDTEKTAYRFSLRVDGKVPFTSPVTTEFGSYSMSAFVKLEDR